ncbi:MAG TPA: response regulator [Anaeromyxobacteraceae bacterium]|nr:response regulator [Anaeromyxobacteraceae bacterium]
MAVAVPQPLRILIVDDEPAVLNLYSRYAERRGHASLLAHDGAEALVVAASERPDIIFLDVAMPKLDGRDVLRQLKANAHTAGIPVLVITASGGDQHLRTLLSELGAADVLEKPVDLPIAFAKAERIAAR